MILEHNLLHKFLQAIEDCKNWTAKKTGALYGEWERIGGSSISVINLTFKIETIDSGQ